MVFSDALDFELSGNLVVLTPPTNISFVLSESPQVQLSDFSTPTTSDRFENRFAASDSEKV